MSDNTLSVWVGENIVCIRITGRANFTSSVDFKTLVNSIWDQGRRHLVLDLTGCTLMDSTFLGILASFGLKFSEAANGDGPATIELINTCPRVADLLDSLGIAPLFKFSQGAPLSTDCLTRLDLNLKSADKKEIALTCLEAHRFLMEVNPANVPKFQDVTRFLEEDVKRLEGGAQTGTRES